MPVTYEREHSRVVAVAFRYGGEFYRLSPNVESAWALLNQQKGVTQGYEQAERVAWRCALSCIRAELALVAMDPGRPQNPAGV